jgi:hypothetical protein
MILKSLLSVALLVSSAAVGAQGSSAVRSSTTSENHLWQAVSLEMSPEEYNRAYRENRRFLRGVFKSQAKAALVSLGISENVVGMLGAAAALALDPDAKLKLNRSKTLVVEFTDMNEEERAIQIGYTLRW